jgi:hypothetical protein
VPELVKIGTVILDDKIFKKQFPDGRTHTDRMTNRTSNNGNSSNK